MREPSVVPRGIPLVESSIYHCSPLISTGKFSDVTSLSSDVTTVAVDSLSEVTTPLKSLYSTLPIPYPSSLAVPLITFPSVATGSLRTGAVISSSGFLVSL